MRVGVLIVTFFLSSACLAETEGDQVKHLSVWSEILQEQRQIRVKLPSTYFDGYEHNYPTFYILDGEWHFETALGVVHHMSSGNSLNWQIPEIIIVSIENNGNRSRDLTPFKSLKNYWGHDDEEHSNSGGADRFLSFVEDELVSFVDENYRTSNHRTIYGHSFGGLAVLYSFVGSKVFDAYIAVDPSIWWADDKILDLIGEHNFEDLSAKKLLHMTSGAGLGEIDPAKMLAGHRQLSQVLMPKVNDKFVFSHRVYADETHQTMPLLGMYHGLKFIFEGHSLTEEILLGGPDVMRLHFLKLSHHIGKQILPPEAFVQMMVDNWDQFMEDDDAKGLLEMNARNYPNSQRAKDALEEHRASQQK